MIDDFLKTKYVKHGRVIPDLDCWGLVRLARYALFGGSLLPSYSHIDPASKGELTVAAGEVREDMGFVECEARPGAIATAWRGSLCVHVGLVVSVDGRLWVMETDAPIGPVLTSCKAFESRYTKVIYYDN